MLLLFFEAKVGFWDPDKAEVGEGEGDKEEEGDKKKVVTFWVGIGGGGSLVFHSVILPYCRYNEVN